MSHNHDGPRGGGQVVSATGANPTNQCTRPTPPGNIMAEVNLLLSQVTTPETNVTFDKQSRSDTTTIKDTINPAEAPHLAWSWENDYAREHQTLTDGDVGKIGYQVNIDSYFKLDDATKPTWSLQPNPDATSSPFELSTGASDAVAYHDFYRLQIAFEDVWAELIDNGIGTTAQELYAKWDALMNAGMGSDINGEEYSAQFDTLSSNLQKIFILISPPSSLPPVVPDWGQVADLLYKSAELVAQVQGNASDAFKSAFGLDMQNIVAELQSAQDGLPALKAGGGTSAINALGAAFEIVTNLNGELSQGAGARIAAYNAIPSGAIGGYDELQKFLNNVRTILDLPTITPPSGSADSNAIDYESYFYNIGQGLKGALDYLDSLVKMIVEGGADPGKSLAELQGPLVLALGAGSAAAKSLKSTASSISPQFMTVYGTYVNAISSSLDSAIGSANFTGLDFQHFKDAASTVNSFLNTVSLNLEDLRSKYKQKGSSGDINSPTIAATDLEFPELETLFSQLSKNLKERYRFDVFAPASINYGLLLNYRQKWEPQSYQVGNLAATIPLAPGETRKYTTKKVVKKSRNKKELNDSLQSKKVDASQTQRHDAEIFDDCNHKTDFSANASGSFKIGVYDVNADAHLGTNHGSDSKDTKRDMHEFMLKSAQEYRDQHHLEVTTEKSSEDEITTSREIRNPNDELTVTYLFYELQRRYLVSESLYRATPVILVANDVPAPHEIDESWLVRHDWILKRVMLDDSFLPALAYLGSEFAGQETALIILELEVQHQKNLVDDLSRQVKCANQLINATTTGVTDAEDWSLNDQRNKEYSAFVKSFFDPLGIGKAGSMDDGNSDRARIDFANEALERAQAKVNDLNSQMRTELTVLQAAVDKYTAAATRHYAMEAQIDRLRLHVKDNILYYMQAIWSHEPTDQRYFRLYNLDVPGFECAGTVTAESASAQAVSASSAKSILAAADTSYKTFNVKFSKPAMCDGTKKLHQVADIDSLIGFKGNYMMFPLVDFENYMAWYLIHNFVEFDPTAGLVVSDPDPGADMTLTDLETAMEAINAHDPATFAANEAQFEEVMLRLLSDQAEQMVIVPSDQLYIEALPGTHPILEDFKLIHRALDVKKVQAEVRHAELENLRLAARLANGEYDDPDIQKKIVVETNGKQNIAVQTGDN